MLQGTRVDLEAARALSKNQAEALVDMAESEKAGARNAQVYGHCNIEKRMYLHLDFATLTSASKPNAFVACVSETARQTDGHFLLH